MCKVCDEMIIKVDSESNTSEEEQLMGEWDLLKRKAERTYQLLKQDTALAQSSSQSSSNVDTITFDLEQSLPTSRRL